MKQWLSRLLPGLGIVLIVLSLMSALRPDPDADTRLHALALRQVGHDYLSIMGDTTSRIPAVETMEDGSYRLKLGLDISYDTLADITRAVLVRMQIREDYQLTLEDCETGETFLGSFWESPFLLGLDEEQGMAPFGGACLTRDQIPHCADFRMAFFDPRENKNGSNKYWFLGLGSLMLFSGILLGRGRKLPPAPEFKAKPILPVGTVLGPGCTFLGDAQKLSVNGSAFELTYREAKLLKYFIAHANNVMERTAIHDSVWGEEGIIVGRSLDVFVSRLRKKLAGAENVEIQTVHGVGYRFSCPEIQQ
jgi:hypothetical protein